MARTPIPAIKPQRSSTRQSNGKSTGAVTRIRSPDHLTPFDLRPGKLQGKSSFESDSNKENKHASFGIQIDDDDLISGRVRTKGSLLKGNQDPYLFDTRSLY